MQTEGKININNKKTSHKDKIKAGFHMIADDRESQIVDRRKFCDRLRSYGNPLLRSFAIVCDRLRSSAIVCDPAIIWKPKFCDLRSKSFP